MPRKARPDPSFVDARRVRSGSRLHQHPRVVAGAVGGDVGIPGLAGGDDGMELTQDRAGQDRLGLGGLELVGIASGEVPVTLA